jgi:hypothetical protein
MNTPLTYTEYEARQHVAHVKRNEHAQLIERKEAQADYKSILLDPEHLNTLAGYLMDGNYSYHAAYIAQTNASNKRMNRSAIVGTLLAEYECNCPARHAAAAWNELTSAQQAAATVAIMDAVNFWIESE